MGSGSGGMPGNGGRGNGGGVGAGGVTPGSGGRVGSGGMVGTGGMGGTGGTVATGGMTGSGGAVGTGGTTAPSCSQLAQDYPALLTQAKACDVASLVNPCTEPVPAGLTCNGDCTTFVVGSAKLKSLLSDWQSGKCADHLPVCPNGCRNPPSSGKCTPVVTTTSAEVSPAASIAPPLSGMCVDVVGVVTTQ
jgi:hypothetical protein